MTTLTGQTGVFDPVETMRDRCRAMSLVTLPCDSAGRIRDKRRIDSPVSDKICTSFFGAEYIQSLLARASARWTDEEAEPRATELFPGLWAIPMPEARRRRRVGYLVAFALEPSALEGEHFEAACQGARVDAEATAEALLPLAVFDKSSVARIAMLLFWSSQDRTEIASDEVALAGFSRQLTESYEEISLLHKLGRSMNELANPRKFVRLVCEELHATLMFRWIAASFLPVGESPVAGRCFTSGDTPWPTATVEDLTQRLLVNFEGDEPRVLDAASSGDPELFRRPGQLLVHPLYRDGALIGGLFAGEKHGEDGSVSSVDMKLIDAAAQHMIILLENAALYDDQQAMFLGTLGAISASIDAKDRYTCGHSERVAMLSMQLAQAAGLPDEVVDRVRICGLVHDVGKIGVPEHVLRKPGNLTDEEYDQIRMHPEIGHRILRDIPQLSDVLPGVLHHHERWDGSGYPSGLIGERIPLMARIIGIADAYDAMRSTRTYRDAMQHATVLSEIRRCSGIQFDPALTPLFVRLDFTEFDRLIERHIRREAGELRSAGAA
jgi:HD-GYP domain-containing protein (c-di-GMP phosphodiesterase class II)